MALTNNQMASLEELVHTIWLRHNDTEQMFINSEHAHMVVHESLMCPRTQLQFTDYTVIFIELADMEHKDRLELIRSILGNVV